MAVRSRCEATASRDRQKNIPQQKSLLVFVVVVVSCLFFSPLGTEENEAVCTSVASWSVQL